VGRDEKKRTAMPRKLREVASKSGELQLATKIRELANQIWLAGLGAFSKAQKEGAKMFEAFVAEGEKVQESTKTFDERLAEGKTRVTGGQGKLEQVIEKRVARALHSLNVPTREDIDVLSKRVAELSQIAKKLPTKWKPKSMARGDRRTRRRPPNNRPALMNVSAAGRGRTRSRPNGKTSRIRFAAAAKARRSGRSASMPPTRRPTFTPPISRPTASGSARSS
jgi:poly(hydroxyalkanoate) granule-associated protein